MSNWKFTDTTERVVFRDNESCLTTAIADWIAEGNTPEPADPINPNVLILAQISEMEQADLTNRGSRELMLRLMQKEGAAQGLSEEQLIADVPFYRILKARDAEIAALRKQIV
jgi:hypothetical protein